MAEQEIFDLTYSQQDIDDKDTLLQAQITANNETPSSLTTLGANPRVLLEVEDGGVSAAMQMYDMASPTHLVSGIQWVRSTGETDWTLNDKDTGATKAMFQMKPDGTFHIGDGMTQKEIATTDILDDVDNVIFTDATNIEPAYVEGRLYRAEGALKFQGKYSDVAMTIGRDLFRPVINNTGATILKGKPCRHNGVTLGKVKIALAQADTFINATILGLAAHDILDGAEGLLMKEGDIEGVDTLGLATGIPIWLSETVAGEFTETRPVISTQLGGVIISDATNGVFSIEIQNNIALPKTLGSLLKATSPTSIPADLVNGIAVESYTKDIEIVTTVNKVLGTITVPIDGVYRVNVSLHMYFDNVGGAGKKEIWLDLVDTSTGLAVAEIEGFILKDAETYSITANGAEDLIGGKSYRLEIRSELALTNFGFSSSTFYIESILY